MSKIVILRGNSGSGKTTVARKLQQLCGSGTLLISQDMVRREMLKVRDEPGNMAVFLMEALVLHGHAHCAVTILEGILHADIYAPLFDTVKETFGEGVYAYYYDLPFQETVRRHSGKPNAHEFGASDMRRWWRTRDFIGTIPETVLTAAGSADETAEMIYRTVMGVV